MKNTKKLMALRVLWRTLTEEREPRAPSITEQLKAAPRLLRDTWDGTYPHLSKGQVGLMLLALAYIISPMDIVPEMFLGLLGIVDDGLVLAWLSGTILKETHTYLDWEREDQENTTYHKDVVGGQVVA